jgi:hypothetical protein
MSLQLLFGMLLLGLAAANAWAQEPYALRSYNCGNEGQPTCGVGEFERYNMQGWTDTRCETDLKASNGVCINEKRRTLPKTGGWLGWALATQRYFISIDEPINRIPWLGSHNAFSNVNQGFDSAFYTNHHYSITDQLNWGVRHLELDPHLYDIPLPLRGPANRLCHATNTGLCLAPGYAQRLFGMALREIDNWLNANPGEVLLVKLNDKNANGAAMRAEIELVLGPKLYRPPTNFTRWPTMREIRQAGKRVLFMQHDQAAPPGNGVTWNANGLVQVNNWPRRQDFANCTNTNGVGPLSQAANSWWDVAEGRSMLNKEMELPYAGTTGDFTGFLWEDEVRRATGCGVALIGLDFINAFWSERNVSPRYFPADFRHHASIWSFAENDWGGYASFDPATRRWVSRPQNELKRILCAPVRAAGTEDQNIPWRVTSSAYPWSKVSGDQACLTEFASTGRSYVFAFPGNGLQNRLVGEYLDSQGITTPIWIGYTTGAVDLTSINPNDLVFSIPQGSTAGGSQTVTFNGPRGAALTFEKNVSWLTIESANQFVSPNTGSADFQVIVNSTASQLTAGTYNAEVSVRTAAAGATPATVTKLNVKLRVQAATITTIVPRQNPIRFGETARFDVQITPVNASVAVKGSFDLTRLNAPSFSTATQRTTALPSFTMSVVDLPVGNHPFTGSFLGSDELQPSDASMVNLVVVPRITVAPSSANFEMNRGATPPLAQNLAISTFSGSLQVSPSAPCSWLSASIVPNGIASASLLLTPSAGASSLPAGRHTCNFTVSDNSSATGGGTTPITATMTVKTQITLDAPVPPLNFLVADQVESRQISISAVGGDNILLTFGGSCKDVFIGTDYPYTATNPIVYATPSGNRQPGLYQCNVTASSEFASNQLVIPVNLQIVKPTIVQSSQPGLVFVVDNTPYSQPKSFVWAPGTQHQITCDTLQTFGNTRYRFASWSSGPAQTQVIIANQNGATYTLNTTPEYKLQTDAVPSNRGSITIQPLMGDGFYAANAQVQLSATPANGSFFTGWTGSLSGLATPQMLTMDGPKALTATFAAQPTTPITITSTAPGAVARLAVPPYTVYPLPVTLNLVQGQEYIFSADPEVVEGPGVRWLLLNWEGSPRQDQGRITVGTSPANLNIRYRRYVLWQVTANPPEAGTISYTGWQIDGGSLPLLATPNQGWRFTGWSGDVKGTANPVDVPVTGPITAVANFAPSSGVPNLFITSTAARTDGTTPGTRVVPLQIRNIGSGMAVDATITGVTNVSVMTGTGLVSHLSPLPIRIGNIAAGGSANQNLVFDWPAGVTRISFTVQFTSNGGSYTGSTTLSLFR